MQSILTICNQLITQSGKMYNYQDILHINQILIVIRTFIEIIKN